MRDLFQKIVSISMVLLLIFSLSGIMACSEHSDFLEVWFLDVGEGDAAAIICGDQVMLIDGGSASASNVVYSFLQKHKIDKIDYIVASHPDEDHIGGLAAVPHAVKSIGAVFCTANSQTSRIFDSFTRNLSLLNVDVIVPDEDFSFRLGKAKVTVLSSDRLLKDRENTSLVLKIEYGDISFLFTGDNEAENEKKLVDLFPNLHSTVLKVAHHGSASSSSEQFLEAVAPEYAVISVGDNSYGHPDPGVLERLSENGVTLFRTDLQGEIHCLTDGKALIFSVERNAEADTYSGIIEKQRSRHPETDTLENGQADSEPIFAEAAERKLYNYIANTNSKKFHYPDCSSVEKIKDENKWSFHGTRDELLENGYSPCGKCCP